jgi:hypothetical protein
VERDSCGNRAGGYLVWVRVIKSPIILSSSEDIHARPKPRFLGKRFLAYCRLEHQRIAYSVVSSSRSHLGQLEGSGQNQTGWARRYLRLRRISKIRVACILRRLNIGLRLREGK